MNYEQLQFIKGLIVKETPLTTVQAAELAREVERAWWSNDDLTGQLHSMALDEEQYLADIKYLREKNHEKGAEISRQSAIIQAQREVFEALENYIVTRALYDGDEAYRAGAELEAARACLQEVEGDRNT